MEKNIILKFMFKKKKKNEFYKNNIKKKWKI